jgi:membrane-associated protease RseP (regulator of RpoE activity)
MHDLLAQTQTTLAAASIFAVWSSVWPYLAMIGGFSLIVFVHELGHFAVAKWAGVRVERFAVGFGKELFGFTRGETRYSFNVLPLGGYVKMLGQEDFDDKSEELRFKDDPRSFINKPVSHRMAIVSAGVVMNILFACLAFMVVFLIGMEAPPARIAGIEPDSPAEKAGLLPGDVIQEVNGEKITDFNELRMAILLAPLHETIGFVVKRDGNIVNFDIKPTYNSPPSTRSIQRLMVGISPGVTGEIVEVGPEIQGDNPNHPRVGDNIVEVDGVAVTDANASGLFYTLPFVKGGIFVERKDPNNPEKPAQRVRVEIPPLLALYPSDPNDPGSVNVLGLTPLARFHLIDPRGRAHLAGLETGDTILSWNDKPHPNVADVARGIRDNAEWDVPFTVQKADGRSVRGFVRPKTHPRGPATIQAEYQAIAKEDQQEGPKAIFISVRPKGSAARAGIEAGDVVLKVRDRDNPTRAEVSEAILANAGKLVPLTIRKPDGRVVQTMVRPVAPGSIDATYNLVADNLLRTGEPIATLYGQPSPAAEAKIPGGARIVTVNGEKVSKWRELIQALRLAAGGTAQISYTTRDGAEHTAPFRVPHSLQSLLGVGPEARIVSIDGRETVVVETNRGKEPSSVGYHEGTRAILKELVGRTQVPVQYRAHPMAPLQTANVDVTEDMVDPWMSRIAFSPSIETNEAKTILRGENALDAVWIGMHKTYYFVLQVYKTMERMIFTRSLGVDSVSGPLGIIDMGGKVAQAGLVKFLFFLAIISANLAVINFLPLPIVDGGLMVFLIIEKIKGSPVSMKVQVATQVVGLFLIIGMFVFVTYQDALRLWG